jgi:hypothetical protein
MLAPRVVTAALVLVHHSIQAPESTSRMITDIKATM